MSLVSLIDVDIKHEIDLSGLTLGGGCFEKHTKFTNKSVIVKRALQLMRRRRQFTIEEYEEVIDPFELILTCHEVTQDYEKRGRNNNE